MAILQGGPIAALCLLLNDDGQSCPSEAALGGGHLGYSRNCNAEMCSIDGNPSISGGFCHGALTLSSPFIVLFLKVFLETDVLLLKVPTQWMSGIPLCFTISIIHSKLQGPSLQSCHL